MFAVELSLVASKQANEIHAMTDLKVYDAAETAKIVRKELKSEFKKDYPETKFSVRIHRYSGGASVNIDWEDGPSKQKVTKVINQFRTQKFEGIDDSTRNEKVFYLGKPSIFPQYFNIKRNTTRAFLERILKYCAARYARWDFEGIAIAGSDSFSNFSIKESVDYEEFEQQKAILYKELNETDGDQELNWEEEKAKLLESEEAREEAIKKVKEKDAEYLEFCKKPGKATKYVGTEYDGMKVIGVQMVFADSDNYSFDKEGNLTHPDYGKFIPPYDQRPKKPLLWIASTVANSRWSVTIDEWRSTINPIEPIEVHVVEYWLDVRFATFQGAEHIESYRTVANNPNLGDRDEESYSVEECKVGQEILLSKEHFWQFAASLTAEHEFLKGQGGFWCDNPDVPDDSRDWKDFHAEAYEETKYREVVIVLCQDDPEEIIIVDPQQKGTAEKAAIAQTEWVYKFIETPNFHEQRNSKVVQLDSRRNKQEIAQSKVKAYLVEQYQTWVTHQVTINPLEIKDFDYWAANIMSVQLLKAAYKIDTLELLNSDRLDEIVAYEDWAKAQRFKEVN